MTTEVVAALVALLVLAVVGWLIWSWARRTARRSRLRWRRRLATLAFAGQIVFFTIALIRPGNDAQIDAIGDVLGRVTGLPPGPSRTAASTCLGTVVVTLAGTLLGWPLDRRAK